MAKTHVIDEEGGTRVPFLRGILTRSLQDAGISFEEAYKLSSEIRQEMNDEEVITTEELRKKVAGYLERDYSSNVIQRYLTPSGTAAQILVRDVTGQMAPFSRAQHQRCLESCGLVGEKSTAVTQKMYRHLVEKGITRVDASHLGYLTYRCLHQDPDLGPDIARRYMVWVDFQHSGRPLILLIGGTTGCGKSTVATELANRLEVVRTQSTDMLREVMRMMIPERLLPALHASSFAAGEALPNQTQTGDQEALLADGYRTQADYLSVPCEAVIQRALRERVSLILEGVHVQPGLLERIPTDTDAVVVPIMLAVLRPERLRKRIRGRGSQAPQRRAERYLVHFDRIWRLQSLLLSEADRAGVPIIANDNKERVIKEAMNSIIDKISQSCTANPRDVFQGAKTDLAHSEG